MLHPLHHTPHPLLAQYFESLLLILLYWSEGPVAPEGLNSQASDKAGVLAKEQTAHTPSTGPTRKDKINKTLEFKDTKCDWAQ